MVQDKGVEHKHGYLCADRPRECMACMFKEQVFLHLREQEFYIPGDMEEVESETSQGS
jgi:hypothetical protein